MSADLDNQPYDNVEFPIRRPPTGATSGGWTSPNMSPTQRGNLVVGSTTKERSYTLPTVTESRIAEEEEDDVEVSVKVEDQRRNMAVTSPPNTASTNSQFVTVSKIHTLLLDE